MISLETLSPQGEHKHNEYTYDAQGNMLSDGNRQYSYDALNRLKEVTNTDGSWQKNRYDGEGLRAELEENGKLVAFIFNDGKVVAEKTDNNTIRYIRGYDLVSSDSESARTYYHYACDELGSITHITDEQGNILNRYEYDAFGNFTLKEETIENRFAFTGEQYDPVSQLYYLRARFYSPAIARFMQEDTYYGDGLNLYSYCHNNPVGYIDPSGNACEKKTGGKKSGPLIELNLQLFAEKNGKKNKKHHKMRGNVTRNGKIVVKDKDYVSGGGKGGYRNGLLYHTERKFLNDIEKKIISGDVISGDHLNMIGELNPCKPGCQPAIRKFVQDNGVTATYIATQKKMVFHWELFNDQKLKGTVLQTVTDSNGKILGRWRYWQNDKGHWKRAKY